MRLSVELPKYNVRAQARLYSEAAPNVTRWIWNCLSEPFETQTSHACFDGHEVFCFLPGEGPPPAVQNQTIRPKVGELMFFGAEPSQFACLAESRMRGSQSLVYELAFMYGEVDLRHFCEEGFFGSLVGVIDQGLDDFASACLDTLRNGRTPLRIRRATER